MISPNRRYGFVARAADRLEVRPSQPQIWPLADRDAVMNLDSEAPCDWLVFTRETEFTPRMLAKIQIPSLSPISVISARCRVPTLFSIPPLMLTRMLLAISGGHQFRA